MIGRKDSHTVKAHPSQRKEVRLAFTFTFAFAFALHLSLSMIKGIKIKEIQQQRKGEFGSRPLLAGRRLGIRIRATLARILIPDPDLDPRLRIQVPVLALKHGLSDFFTDFYGPFGLKSHLKDMLRRACVKRGNCFH
jgi:hypothetical protein